MVVSARFHQLVTWEILQRGLEGVVVMQLVALQTFHRRDLSLDSRVAMGTGYRLQRDIIPLPGLRRLGNVGTRTGCNMLLPRAQQHYLACIQKDYDS